MKNLILLIVFSIASLGATESQNTMGAASYMDKTFNTLTVMGPLTGTSLTATTLDIYGPTSLFKGSKIGTATIRGPLTAHDTSFTGPVEVYGTIEATDSDFKDDLTIDGDESTMVIFENSSAKGIQIAAPMTGVQQTSSGATVSYTISTKKELSKGPQVILKGKKTSVTGPIEFMGQTGNVILADDAIFTGNVINGKVEKKVLENKKTEIQKEGVSS